jgi:hypothetical protein
MELRLLMIRNPNNSSNLEVIEVCRQLKCRNEHVQAVVSKSRSYYEVRNQLVDKSSLLSMQAW